MITRVWHGRSLAENADEYLRFLTERAVPDYKAVKGNLGVEVWRRFEGDVCHFWTVTTWDGLESIKSFAGDDVEKAKYYAEDPGFLLEFEATVIHCETYKF